MTSTGEQSGSESYPQEKKGGGCRRILTCVFFFVHGVTILLPWNVFITNNEYFVGYKMNSTDASTNKFKSFFLNYLGISFFTIICIFSYINLFITLTCNLTSRMVFTLSIILALVIGVIIMIFIPFGDVRTFFSITIVISCLVSVFSGIYQTSVFGVVAGFPQSCMRLLQCGMASSGVVTSLFVIMAHKALSNPVASALIYFLAAVVFIILSIVSSPILHKFKKSLVSEDVRDEIILRNEGVKKEADKWCVEKFKKDVYDYCSLLKKVKTPLISLLLTSVVSLACFPGVIANIQPLSSEPPLHNSLFTMVFVFLFFNTFMLAGTLVNFCQKLMIPVKAALVISVLRISCIGIFIFSNISPSTRSHHVVFGDNVFIVTNVFMAFSHGYLSSLLFVATPQLVSVEWREKAGMLASCANTTGILLGVALSLLLVHLV